MIDPASLTIGIIIGTVFGAVLGVVGFMKGAELQMRRRQANAHPASGRFCHICGADFHKGDRCDAGLHS